MGRKIDEAITRYKNNAEYERTHDNLQGCLEFRQLARWLKELRAYRSLDSDTLIELTRYLEGYQKTEQIIIDTAPTVEAIPKDQYEARLKADMVTMLRFLWNDIEDLDAPICDYASSDCISKWQVHEVIQQKISKLRGNEECGNIDG